MPNYPEELITAVKWLIYKGVTRSSDIARRLEVSPYTVNNIKTLLRKRGDFPEPRERRKKRKREEKKEKKKSDWISRMFGGGKA
ncbi:hypothetical protein DRN85_09880 [Methanosarcinales archaeon]|nr:MAG: hypothetical protein DRN85_09880 [Methanosarcinales archaeon]